MRCVSILFLIVLAGCSADLLPSSTGGAVSTTITSVVKTDSGVTLSVNVTNSDTGAIAYSSYCPGVVQRLAGSWAPISDTPTVCRATAKSIEPGGSVTFVAAESKAAIGYDVRFVFNWLWLNGNGPVGGTSTSQAVNVE